MPVDVCKACFHAFCYSVEPLVELKHCKMGLLFGMYFVFSDSDVFVSGLSRHGRDLKTAFSVSHILVRHWII